MIRAATVDDFPQIASLIVVQSERPERRCIHSDPRSGVDDALAELEQLEDIDELIFVIALDQGRLVGCAGAEFDLGLRRAWLRGPFTEAEDETAWSAQAGELLRALEAKLPAMIKILDGFLDLAHVWGQRVYQTSGYRQVRKVHVYQAKAGERPAEAPAIASCGVMQAEHAARVAELHRKLFPNTYLTAEAILAGAAGEGNENRRLYVFVEDGQALGYVYGRENLGEGVVDFLGVDEGARRRGIGRALLTTILRWIFDERGLETASLTVHDELVNARALYEQAGFCLLYTGVHLRKER
jgi:ribosomal protein S18 acetylase RimI-like enzyme